MKKLHVFTGLYALLLFLVLLMPFDFHFPYITQEIKWLSDTNGVQISSTAGIRSTLPARKLYDELVSGDGITIEVWVATEDFNQEGPARIVSYSYDKLLRNFTMGQENRSLVLRLRTTNTDLNGSKPQFKIEDIFTDGKPQHIAVTYDYVNEIVYINGEKKFDIQGPGGSFSNWDPSYPIVLGNEATGNRPWIGKLYLVAIYKRALSEEEIQRNYYAGFLSNAIIQSNKERITDSLITLYLFNDKFDSVIRDESGQEPLLNLNLATGQEITDQSFLEYPYQDLSFSFPTIIGVIGNIIIFIPFGLLMHQIISVRYQIENHNVTALIVIVIGTFFTIGIESLQYFSLSRFSSLTDVINNVAGTAIGILIERLYHL